MKLLLTLAATAAVALGASPAADLHKLETDLHKLEADVAANEGHVEGQHGTMSKADKMRADEAAMGKVIEENEGDHGEYEEDEGRHAAIMFPPQGNPTVRQIATTKCNTGELNALSRQIINCGKAIGQEFTCIDDESVIRGTTNAALPCFQAAAAEAVRAASREKNDFITISSGLRTPVQQMMLYIHRELWLRNSATAPCRQRFPVAKPGGSNHNGGMAMDVSASSYWRSTFRNNGWRWYGSGDPVHYDFSAGNPDARKAMLKAFQKLWNLNQTEERFRLDEDGKYGPNTRRALEAAPANGFETTCDA